MKDENKEKELSVCERRKLTRDFCLANGCDIAYADGAVKEWADVPLTEASTLEVLEEIFPHLPGCRLIWKMYKKPYKSKRDLRELADVVVDSWERNLEHLREILPEDGEGASDIPGAELRKHRMNCAFCRAFFYCAKCPVYLRTGHSHCRRTPFEAVRDAEADVLFREVDKTPAERVEALLSAVENELNFLKEVRDDL